MGKSHSRPGTLHSHRDVQSCRSRQQECRDLRYSNRLATPAGSRVVDRRYYDDRDDLPAYHRSESHWPTPTFTIFDPTLLITRSALRSDTPCAYRVRSPATLRLVSCRH